MQTCKGIFSFKRIFFAEGRPDGVRKYGKMRPKHGNIRPVWTRPSQKDFCKKTHLFFTSVRPSVKTVSAAGTTRSGRVGIQTPCIFRISVAMCKCLPPLLIVKSRRRFYISTRIVDPKLFGQEALVMRLGLNDV